MAAIARSPDNSDETTGLVVGPVEVDPEFIDRLATEVERLREALRLVEIETCCDSEWSDLRLFSACEEAYVIARKALAVDG